MRQFILNGQKIVNGLVNIDGKDFRYLRQVLRVKPGDMISLRLESGELKAATVSLIDEKAHRILLQICAESGYNSRHSVTRGVQAEELTGLNEGVEFWLFQFITKAQKFEQIVRQATECGVLKIVPIAGMYSEKSSVMAQEGAKRERLERIIKEARQQSGSPVNTEVLQPHSLEDAIDLWNENPAEESLALVLYERTDFTEPLQKVIEEFGRDKIRRVCICCGCEGGISPSEIEILCKKGLFHPLHFAVNILRAETAALYGIAAVQSNIL
ncbi:MAG: 16S rRNA (uracil(1498)-N(3))-methyltransferase [Treponema sp.]|nr:16S rRNA (uracil(1498)-N(3))-methyltransferase [Treponema sp.]